MPEVVAELSDVELDKLADEGAEDSADAEFEPADVDATEVEFEPADVDTLIGSEIDTKSEIPKVSKALKTTGAGTLSPPPERLGNSSLTPTFWSTTSFDMLVSSVRGGQPRRLVFENTDSAILLQKFTLK